MGIAEQFGGMLGGAGGRIGSAVNTLMTVLFWGAVFIGIGYAIYRWQSKKQYDMTTLVFSKRSGTLKYISDVAAYTKNKLTDLWDFRLKKHKEVLAPPPYGIMIPGEGGSNVVAYYQKSASEFYPARIEVVEPEKEEEVWDGKTKDKDGNPIKTKCKLATIKVKVVEPDIALWNMMMGEKLRETYQRKSKLEKWMPLIQSLGVAMVLLIMIWLVSKEMGGLKEVASSLASSLQKTAQQIQDTAVQIASGVP